MKRSVDALYIILADNISTITDSDKCPCDLRQIKMCLESKLGIQQKI